MTGFAPQVLVWLEIEPSGRAGGDAAAQAALPTTGWPSCLHRVPLDQGLLRASPNPSSSSILQPICCSNPRSPAAMSGQLLLLIRGRSPRAKINLALVRIYLHEKRGTGSDLAVWRLVGSLLSPEPSSQFPAVTSCCSWHLLGRKTTKHPKYLFVLKGKY